MPNDRITTGLNALRALEAASHKDELAFTAYALALRNSAPQMLAVIEVAAEVVDIWEADRICASDRFRGELDAALVRQCAALNALAAVLGKGE